MWDSPTIYNNAREILMIVVTCEVDGQRLYKPNIQMIGTHQKQHDDTVIYIKLGNFDLSSNIYLVFGVALLNQCSSTDSCG